MAREQRPASPRQPVLKQSKNEVLPRLPVRAILAAPSGGGKGVLISRLLLEPEYYRGLFSRIYYFSQSAKVDHHLNPLKAYCEDELGQKEPCVYDTFDEDFVTSLLERQLRVAQFLKENKSKRAFGIAIICDDFADDPQTVRKAGGILSSLFSRGRHGNVSTIILTQTYRALSPMIRTNATMLAVFRLRNRQDLQAILDENSALLDRESLEKMYRRATEKDFGFLLIDLASRDLNHMFYSSFDTRFQVQA
jgi:hypothetical protein